MAQVGWALAARRWGRAAVLSLRGEARSKWLPHSQSNNLRARRWEVARPRLTVPCRHGRTDARADSRTAVRANGAALQPRWPFELPPPEPATSLVAPSRPCNLSAAVVLRLHAPPTQHDRSCRDIVGCDTSIETCRRSICSGCGIQLSSIRRLAGPLTTDTSARNGLLNS